MPLDNFEQQASTDSSVSPHVQQIDQIGEIEDPATFYYNAARGNTKSNVINYGFSDYWHEGSGDDWNGDGPKGYYNDLEENEDIFPAIMMSSKERYFLQMQLNEAVKYVGMFLLAVDEFLSTHNIEGPDTVQLLTSATYQAMGKVNGYRVNSWEWDFNYHEGNFHADATGRAVTTVFYQSGDRTIALQAFVDGHAPIIVTKAIYVKPLPIEVTFPERFESLDRHFSTVPSEHITQYTWNFGDGTPTASGSIQDHTYPISGYYTVTLTLTLDDGSTTSSQEGILVGPGTRYIQGHTIYGYETWYSGGTYVLEGSIYVARGGMLTIEPGVVVQLSGGGSITVQGVLEATGATFTWADGQSRWAGMQFLNSGASGSRLENCTIEYTNGAYSGSAIRIDGASPTIVGCTINNSIALGGVSISNGSPTVSNNTISGFNQPGSYAGITAINSSPSVTGNTITGCSTGINVSSDSSGTYTGNTLTGNGTAINVSYASNNPVFSGNTYSNNTDNLVVSMGVVSAVTWGSVQDSNYKLTGLTINSGASLTIPQGSVIKLGPNAPIVVGGTLIATGATFTWADGQSRWAGMQFLNSGASGSRLENCTIEYTNGAYSGSAIRIDGASPTIVGCTINNSIALGGVSISNGSPTVSNNTISGFNQPGSYAGITAINSSPSVTGNTITGCSTGINVSSDSSGTYTGNTFSSNSSYGFYYSGTGFLDAKNCNWGDPSGPLDTSDDRASGGLYNPNGLGNRVSDHVNYYPWVGSVIGTTAVPTGLDGVSEDKAINLTWNANTEPYLSGYKIYYGTSPGNYGSPKITGNVNTYRVTGLTNGTKYYLTISSMNTVGVESAKAPEIEAVPMIDVDKPTSSISRPTTGALIIGSSYIITGTADDGSGSGVKKAEISLDGGNTWVAATGTTTWTYTWALPQNGTYTIKSRATDKANNVEIPGHGVTVTVAKRQPKEVTIEKTENGFQMLINGNPFTMKGIGYSPTPIGETPAVAPFGDYFTPDRSGIYTRDLPLLRAMGANTLRLRGWGSTANHLDFLDSAYNSGVNPIYVIAGFQIDAGLDIDPASPTNIRDQIKSDFRTIVATHKNHPAILMWCIGNELNGTTMYGGNLDHLVTLIDEMAAEAHLEEGESYHPVTTALADSNLVAAISAYEGQVPNLDVWGANVYRGHTFGSLFNDYKAVSSKPLIILGYGIDAYDNQNGDEYEMIGRPYQAEYAEALWNEIVSNPDPCIGGSLAEYSDEWWKGSLAIDPNCQDTDSSSQGLCGYMSSFHPDGYANEEWWGIMRVQKDGTNPDIMIPRVAYYGLQYLWAGTSESRTLIATKGGAGTGTVTSIPPGIDCGAVCSKDYIIGTVVSLTAVPSPDSLFTGWSGGSCSGTEPCTVVMTGGHTVIANFAPQTYTIVATAGAGGTIDPTGSITVNYGGTQRFTIGATAGYHIVDLLVDDASVGPLEAYTFDNVRENHSIVPIFAINTYTVNASAPDGHGTINPTTQTVNHGDNASISITPATGYHIASITDNGALQATVNPYVISAVTGSHNVVVIFAIDTFMVSASVAGGQGTVDPATQTVNYGDSASINIMATAGYHIASITDNGLPRAIVNPYVVSNVTGIHDVVVSFAIDTYGVSASVAGGQGTVDPTTQTVNYGGNASINITPATWYHLASITDNGVSQTVINPYVISAVTGSHNVAVTFAIDTYAVSASVAGGQGAVNPTTQTVNYGDNASISITPATGYRIASITDNGVSQAIVNPFVISNVTGVHNVLVTFSNVQSFHFTDDFSTDKGWSGYEIGGWERGPATVGGGENGYPDPGTDHSASGDNNILGFVIGGDYSGNLTEKSIISPPIDCTGQSQVFIKYWRYLNVGSNYYDHARVLVSNDGTNWTQFWENPVFDLTENQWTQVIYDISSVAANQGTVYVKFTMGPTNSTRRFSGWNIDDFEVTSVYSGPMALYAPYGDTSNPNIDEILIQEGFGIRHSNDIPGDLSIYPLMIVDRNEACSPSTAASIKSFVQNGGGAIIMGECPKYLAGNTEDLSSIGDWFGAGTYGTDGGYASVTINHPFGTDLLVGDKVDYSSSNDMPSVLSLNPESTAISTWASFGKTHSFIHSFGQGRVFYYAGDPGYCQDPDPQTVLNSLTLFEEGLLWTSNLLPEISVSPPSKDFGSLDVGKTSSPQTFTVSNTSKVDLVIGTLSITGTDFSQFTGQNDTCSGRTIVPPSTCTVDVTFSPTSAGTKNASLSIPSNDPDTPALYIPLMGTGISVTGPDLIETSVSNPPAGALAGSRFSVTDTAKNKGNAPSGASRTQYYLSLDTIKSGEDTLLTGGRAVAALAPGATSSGTVNVTIPFTTPMGTYYLLACADDRGVVAESDETNNCIASGSMVVVGMPDLIETSVSNPPAGALAGSRFSVTDTAKNKGNGSSGASRTQYYLSLDTIKSGEDTLLTGGRAVAALAPEATSIGTVNVTIPFTTPMGTYYLLACADDRGVVAESDETNNCIASGSMVVVGMPDLIETSVSNPPAGALAGSRFSVTDTAKNKGNGSSGASRTQYYLSLDTIKSGEDTLLTGGRAVAALAPEATSSGTVNVTIPFTTPMGTYYLLACADDRGVVAESDETNNCIASGSMVVVGMPDLIETSVSNPPAGALAGSRFSVTDTAKNKGNGSSGASRTQYYLSLDTIKSGEDTLLTGGRAVAALAPEATSSGTVNVTIPFTTPMGTYYLLACADDRGVVAESDETNNCIASGSMVQVTP